MNEKFLHFTKHSVSFGDFHLKARDAYDTYNNIKIIFKNNAGWFRSPKPIHIKDLCNDYKKLCPDMEVYHPGVIDQIFIPEIIRQLGFSVDSGGMVSFN